MASRVDTTALFDRKLEKLGRKYPGAPDDVDSLIDDLERDQRPGDKIPHAGYDVYKVRLGNPSGGRGKRGGFRVVYYLRRKDDVLLLTIYAKTERQDIGADEIRRIIDEFGS